MHIERGQETPGNHINNFSERKSFWGAYRPFLSQNWHVLITLNAVQGCFFKYCIMRVANRHIKFTLVVLPRNILLRVDMLLWTLKCCILRNSGSALKDLLIILHNEKGEETMKIKSWFFRKLFIWLDETVYLTDVFINNSDSQIVDMEKQ